MYILDRDGIWSSRVLRRILSFLGEYIFLGYVSTILWFCKYTCFRRMYNCGCLYICERLVVLV